MSIKKYIPFIIIFVVIISVIGLGIWYSDKNSPIKELAKLDLYSKEELSFLEKEGFLDNIDSENLPSNKEQALSLFKSSTLIEQNLNSPDESFEVLATKLDESTYQLAFKLENKSDKKKEFYLIPMSDESQLEFKEIKASVKGKAIWGNHGDWAYDIEKHKQELRPELAQAYNDIDNNGYTGKPVKLVLEPNSILIALSKWEIKRGQASDSLEPIYLLVYGSAGGAKDELTILNVHSHPKEGDYWKVSFETKGMRDLIITPEDQNTIEDMDFVSLKCGDEERTPQILENDVILYENWYCFEEAEIVHIVNVAAKHTLKFQFGEQTAFAYNNPDPAIITRYVDPDASGAGNGTSWTDAYTALETWNTTEAEDITAAGSDEIHIVNCRSSGGSADTTAVSMSDWTTDSTHTITIQVATADRHDGTRGTGYRLNISTSWVATLNIGESYVTIDGLAVNNDAGNASAGIYFVNLSNITIKNCLSYDNNGGGIIGYSACSSIIYENCISVGNGGYGFRAKEATIKHCTSVANDSAGFYITSYGTFDIFNCYAGGNGGDDYGGSVTNHTYNMTTCHDSDGTADTTTAYSTSEGAYFTNVTAGSEDLTIANASSALIEAGTGGVSTYDFEGEARDVSSPDIGADEYVASSVRIKGSTIRIKGAKVKIK